MYKRQVEHGKAAAQILTMGNQRQLDIGRRDAGDRHQRHIAVVQECLDAGTRARSLVNADKIAVRKGRCSAVQAAAQLKLDRLFVTAGRRADQVDGRDSLGIVGCADVDQLLSLIHI